MITINIKSDKKRQKSERHRFTGESLSHIRQLITQCSQPYSDNFGNFLRLTAFALATIPSSVLHWNYWIILKRIFLYFQWRVWYSESTCTLYTISQLQQYVISWKDLKSWEWTIGQDDLYKRFLSIKLLPFGICYEVKVIKDKKYRNLQVERDSEAHTQCLLLCTM